MAAKPKEKEVETPPKETPPVETPKEKVEEVEIDTKKLEEEVVTAAKEKLAETLTGKEDKKWVPKDFEEIKDTTKTETLKEVDKKFEERDEKVKEAEKTKKKKDAADLKKWDTYWKGQVTKLTEEGYLPKPPEEIQKKLDDSKTLTEDEMKDPSMVARANVYEKAREIKESNLELVYHRDIRGKPQSPGAQAPVLGTRKGVAPPPSDEEFSYEDISPQFSGPKSVSELMQKES